MCVQVFPGRPDKEGEPMMRPAVLVLAAAAALTWAFADDPSASAQNGNHAHSAPASPKAWSRGSEFSRALHDSMARMHEEMLSALPSGDADRDFLALMIPHHEGAVEMARFVLISGRDPLVRRLAEEIIASQQAEIAAMKARLAILRNGADPNPDGFPALGATRGE
jgi:uncharacterized protein (DUF305 family)